MVLIISWFMGFASFFFLSFLFFTHYRIIDHRICGTMERHIGEITLLQFHIVEKRLKAKLSDPSYCGNQERIMPPNSSVVPLCAHCPGSCWHAFSGSSPWSQQSPEMNRGAQIRPQPLYFLVYDQL